MSGSPGNPLTIPVNQCLSCNVVMETTKREISNAVRQKTGRDRRLGASQQWESCAEHKRTVGGIHHAGVEEVARPCALVLASVRACSGGRQKHQTSAVLDTHMLCSTDRTGWVCRRG